MLDALACGAVLFPGLFLCLRKLLPCAFARWSDADVVLVSERLVSSIHAVMATVSGIIVVSSCRSNVIADSHWLAKYFVIWYGVPYMAYDIYAMYLSHYYRFRVKGHEDYKGHSWRTVNSFVRREFLLVLHHIALLTVLLPITLFFRKDQGDFFIGCLFLTEVSTPFVSLGKILIQLGLQSSWVHKVNGGMVLLTFFMCRIALFPYMYWVYGAHYGLPVYLVPFHLPLSANLGNLCILAPQVYWFVLLCRKGYRLYKRSRAAQTPQPVTDRADADQ
ncbi:protein FAM57B-like [Denticeps clupeoides]|uniref:protein FAM57B-like n=1 Tax=Denticeps clupeoides TaxID=299321 RepID=UPI0010A5766F|nr:protein FAM57B-like [Denticeps clupeoides]XP_028839437.1 protein FAM57B-like [Denticeps clupeoides]